jgi:4-diphosphocytidyl-2-C-methyl-D-erythritol kinase
VQNLVPVARRCPAKINLGLHVLRRRPDGYHEVATGLIPIRWHDEVRVAPAEDFSFTCSDRGLGGEGNLCVRATRALATWAGIEPTGALHLEKRVPHGAGLGGGSSNAAHTLRLLAEHWGLEVPPTALHDLAASLGSDVPFFLNDQPMIATGRGEVLTPVGEGYRMPFPLAVVMPPVAVSTAEAYAFVTPSDRTRPDLRAALQSNDPDRWRRELENDFEAPILSRHQEIAQERTALETQGARYAALSGSGAAVFGVFEAEAEARAAAEAARADGLAAWWGYAEGGGEPSSGR